MRPALSRREARVDRLGAQFKDHPLHRPNLPRRLRNNIRVESRGSLDSTFARSARSPSGLPAEPYLSPIAFATIQDLATPQTSIPCGIVTLTERIGTKQSNQDGPSLL